MAALSQKRRPSACTAENPGSTPGCGPDKKMPQILRRDSGAKIHKLNKE